MQASVTTEMIFWYSNPPYIFRSLWYAETSFPQVHIFTDSIPYSSDAYCFFSLVFHYHSEAEEGNL